jgi:hypothetical protein
MTPNRRHLLIGAAAAGVAAALAPGAATAHTPYGQWVVYRQKHLLVGAHRGDGRTYDLAQAVVEALGRELPDARARVARGPRPQRIASLMSTGQLRVAVIRQDEAVRMAAGLPPFEGYLPTPLQVMAALIDGYFVYGSPDLPEDHAWLVTEALDAAGIGTAPPPGPIPAHPGARLYWNGGATPG